MLLAWMACIAGHDDLAGHPAADDDDDSVVVPPTEPAPLAEALAERCPDPTPRRRVMPPGDDLHRVTLAGPSRCNDGSPPVIYVRAATEPAHADDWVLHLESGGICRSHEECAIRWCGEDGYDAGNMSSRWSDETAGGLGIAAAAPENTFAGWNQVELHYCSSDFWMGRRPGAVLDGDPPYVLHFEGHDILGDALDALLAGAVSDDGAATLPPLLPAKTVIFGGSSAGGFGTLYQLWRVIDALPGAQIVATPDAVLSPSPEAVTPEITEAIAADNQRQWEEALWPVFHAYVDERCAASVAEDEPWRCLDVDLLVRGPAAPTDIPMVYHHDLLDPVLFGYLGPMGLSTDAYVEAGARTLRQYGSLPGVSVHGPACGDHTALDNDVAYVRQRVTDAVAGPPDWSLHDVLAAGLHGQQVVAVDRPSGVGSICP